MYLKCDQTSKIYNQIDNGLNLYISWLKLIKCNNLHTFLHASISLYVYNFAHFLLFNWNILSVFGL